MSSSSSLCSASPKLLEVEQKFSFSDRTHIEDRLRQKGFAPVKEITMADWYFDRFVDDQECDLELPLIQNDHWLRYREIISDDGNGTGTGNCGQWQLKRGNTTRKDDGGATVYEEIEGIEAVEIALSLLREQTVPSPPSKDSEEVAIELFDGRPIPTLPIPDCDVSPFARIVTHRAKWKQDPSTDVSNKDDSTIGLSRFSNLTVDLDTTPDGFAIGEVEAVVEEKHRGGEDDFASVDASTRETTTARNDRAVARARNDIHEFLALLLPDGDDSATGRRPPMGKLEHFLFRNRPRMYEECVELGVIPAPPPSSTPAEST